MTPVGQGHVVPDVPLPGPEDPVRLIMAWPVVTIDAGDNPEKSGTRLAAALARHGAHVSVNELSSAGRPIADVLADHVDLSGADLLVMGAYGHSRLREFLFGGVTRSVLRAMPVATFMSR